VAAAAQRRWLEMVIRVAEERVYYFPHPTIIATCYDDHAEIVVIPDPEKTARWRFRVSFKTAYEWDEDFWELDDKFVLPLYIQQGLEKKCLYVDEEVQP
jgi:hypothetical protein